MSANIVIFRSKSLPEDRFGTGLSDTIKKNAMIKGLTAREIEIMDKVSLGKLNKEIAFDLSCQINTVKKHLQHIYSKLCVHNRTEATLKYLVLIGKIKVEIKN